MPQELTQRTPNLLTPGAAEALSVKVYRMLKTNHPEPLDALTKALQDYQAPVAPEIIAEQIKLAVAEATDLSFVPNVFR